MGKKKHGGSKRKGGSSKTAAPTKAAKRAAAAASADEWAAVEAAIRANEKAASAAQAKNESELLDVFGDAMEAFGEEEVGRGEGGGEGGGAEAEVLAAQRAHALQMKRDMLRQRRKLARRKLPPIPRPGECVVDVDGTPVDVGDQLAHIPRHMQKERHERWAYFYDVQRVGAAEATKRHPWVANAVSTLKNADDTKLREVALQAQQRLGIDSEDGSNPLMKALSSMRTGATSSPADMEKVKAELHRTLDHSASGAADDATAPAEKLWDVEVVPDTAPSIEEFADMADGW
jgi:hypothetical protein